MMTHKPEGGEFYAESTCERSANCTKLEDSSVKQHGSVAYTAMLLDVAARIPQDIRAFSFAPSLPHAALKFLNMKTPKHHP